MKCRCGYEFTDDDFAPAIDAMTGAPVCDRCTRAQRHARQNPTFEEIRMADLPTQEEW